MKMIKHIERYSLWIGLFFVFLFVSPIFFMGKDVFFCIYDGLEYIPMYQYIAKSGKMLASNYEILPHLMNGLPRVSFPSELYFIVWLFYFFDPFVAYSINLIIIHFVTFIGARIFVRNHIADKFFSNLQMKNFLVDGSALYFALLPHWPLGGLSIAGMPLLLNSFLNIYDEKSKKIDWLIIILLPFYSSFIFSNMFVIIILLGFWFVQAIYKKNLRWKFLLGLLVYFVMSVIVEYRIFLSVIDGFESHRGNVSGVKSISLIEFVQRVIYRYDLLIKSYMDAPIKIFPFVLLMLFLSGSVSYVSNQKSVIRIFGLLLGVIFFASYLNYFKLWILPVFSHWSFLYDILRGLTFRAYVLSPFLWLCVFSFSILGFYKVFYHSRGLKFLYTILILNAIYLLMTTGTTYSYNVSNGLESTFSNNLKSPHPTYKEYFDTELFENIKNHIKETYHMVPSQYRVISIVDDLSYPQFSSMILFSNGFYTIDGYCVYYPKKHREIFESIIFHQYDINNKVYVYPVMSISNNEKKIEYLNIDYELIKTLNVQFVFSVSPIKHISPYMKLEGIFKGIYWKIYLYKIIK